MRRPPPAAVADQSPRASAPSACCGVLLRCCTLFDAPAVAPRGVPSWPMDLWKARAQPQRLRPCAARAGSVNVRAQTRATLPPLLREAGDCTHEGLVQAARGGQGVDFQSRRLVRNRGLLPVRPLRARVKRRRVRPPLVATRPTGLAGPRVGVRGTASPRRLSCCWAPERRRLWRVRRRALSHAMAAARMRGSSVA